MKPGFKLLFALVLAGRAYPQSNVIINEYAVPTASSQPTEITLGPDGALWFTENAGNNIGRITSAGAIAEFPIPTANSYPIGITAGPDGALWFTESAANKIGRIDVNTKAITEYTVPVATATPYEIAAGPDGALWFTESTYGIGRITTGGVFTEYSTGASTNQYSAHPASITAGPDGAMWFTVNAQGFGGNPGSIWRITMAGAIGQASYTAPYDFPASSWESIILGPDGALWFADGCEAWTTCTPEIGRLTTGGTLTGFGPVIARAIAFGPDGALWLAESKLGRLTLSGAFTEYSTTGAPYGIAGGTDRVWFTEQSANLIGSIVPGSSATVNLSASSFPAGGGTGSATVTVTPANAPWNALSYAGWITVTSGPTFTGSGTVTYSVAANNSISARSGTLAIAGQQFTVTQAGMTPSFSVSPLSANMSAGGGTGSVSATATPPDASWTAASNAPWMTITSGASGTGSGTVNYTVVVNTSTNSRSGTLTIAGQTFTVTQAGSGSSVQGLYFYPVTPCRVADTRSIGGKSGAFGPPSLAGGSPRDFPISASSCSISPSASAYSLNITAMPAGPLNYLSLWPNDQAQPTVSTLNSFDGRVVANAAIVPAGSNGSTRVFASNATDLIIDVNGYFAAPASQGLAFYPVTPCRVADTRGNGKTGAFGPPGLAGDATRDFPIPSGGCGIPASAQAYSLNLTAVPPGPLTYLSAGPAGQALPTVSTLNSFDGSVVANAAIVPAGASGSISVFGSNATDLIIDINGYFAAPGGAGALAFYPATPCRVADTRGNGFPTGPFGPPSLSGGATRSFPVPSGPCGIPASAQAFSLNMTVVPPGPLKYLTSWPAGQPQPAVSTLNSFAGKVVANAAIVPAGMNEAINEFASNTTDLIVDTNGYFAPLANVVPVDLSSAYNRTGIAIDAVTFSAANSLDGAGGSYSTNLLGSTRIWNGALFNLGLAGTPDAVSGTGNTVALAPGKFSSLMMLATGVNGNQPSQVFTVNYSDGTKASFTQSLSDWFAPQGYPGESNAVSMAYRDYYNGTRDNETFYLYGYIFGLNNSKTVASITLPNNSNVVVLALTLVP